MSDQTPRVPDLWWSPDDGVIMSSRASGYWIISRPVHSFIDELPADAVKLVPSAVVERFKQGLRKAVEQFDDGYASPWDVVDMVRAIVEGETR